MSNKIIVGVDISDLKVAATGQKTFLAELCTQFKLFENAKANDHTVVPAIASKFKFVYFSSPFPIIKSRSKLSLLTQHFFYQIWKQLLLPIKAWANGCNIVFCTDYFVPYFHLGFKTVQVFHDAFFFENPEHYNKYWFILHKYLAMPAARKSSFIVTPSNYALQTVHALAGIPLHKLVRIYEAPKSFDNTIINTTDPALAGFIHSKYIFHVGVMEKRKNILTLVKAFHLLIQLGGEFANLKLVLAGKGTGRAESDITKELITLIHTLHLQEQVILTGYLTDAQLKTTYQHAFMYVFPSLNEGFGIPVLEAFKAQIPVLVANNSCLPEIGGDAVIIFDPYNEADLCDKMQLVLTSSSLRKELIEKGNIRLASFSWEHAALELLKVFERAAQ